MEKAVLMLVALLMAFGLGWCSKPTEQEPGNNGPDVVVKVDTIWRVDTVRVTEPVMITERVTDTVRILIPQDNKGGQPAVNISALRVQRTFAGDDYTAWVSGLLMPSDKDQGPRLDSLHIERDVIETIVTVREKERRKRWGLGVAAGVHYDFARGKPAPFVGVGVQYNIYSW